mgnify:CR=1 FL=1
MSQSNFDKDYGVIKTAEKIQSMTQDPELMLLANTISGIVNSTKQGIAPSVNTAIVEAYWNIGRHIVEFEQHGEVRAKYGSGLLSNLAKILSATLGKGFSRPNLQQMRKFYLTYPICQTVSSKLSWSHICELSRYKDDLMVEYATYGMDTNLFVSKYELLLPNIDELRAMVRRIVE